MAIVNIDLSEYDSLRNRKKELEERVKELEQQVNDLKSGSKAIIRTYKESIDFSRGKYDKVQELVSESYVGFEDVRLKVEEAMKAEIASSIKKRNDEAEAYRKKRDDLKATMDKEYEEFYDGKVNYFKNAMDSYEKENNNNKRAFSRIKQLTDCVLSDLCGRFFQPSSAIRLVETIKVVASTKDPDATVDDSGIRL